MMRPRTLPAQTYAGLKTAFRVLVACAGGLEAAAVATRVSVSRLAEYYDPRNPAFPPVDVVADLESVTHDPLMLAALARSAGYLLLPMPDVRAGALADDLARLATETGHVFAAVAECLGDGKLDCSERARLAAEIGDVARVAHQALAHLRQIEAVDA